MLTSQEPIAAHGDARVAPVNNSVNILVTSLLEELSTGCSPDYSQDIHQVINRQPGMILAAFKRGLAVRTQSRDPEVLRHVVRTMAQRIQMGQFAAAPAAEALAWLCGTGQLSSIGQ